MIFLYLNLWVWVVEVKLGCGDCVMELYDVFNLYN